jgi:hypothetical protein
MVESDNCALPLSGRTCQMLNDVTHVVRQSTCTHICSVQNLMKGRNCLNHNLIRSTTQRSNSSVWPESWLHYLKTNYPVWLTKITGFYFSVPRTLLSSHKSEIWFYLAAPSPSSGSTPATGSPGPAKSAATRSPVSVATLILVALVAPLSYYYLWRLYSPRDSFHGLLWCVWALLRDLVTTLWRETFSC